MKVTMYLRYASQWGEQLFIEGDCDALKKDGKGIPMEYTPDGWHVTFYTEAKVFRYNFYIERYGRRAFGEMPLSHQFGPYEKELNIVLIYESLSTSSTLPRILKSAVMSKAIRKHAPVQKKKMTEKLPVIFNTFSTDVNYNHQLAIVGSSTSLGRWTEEGAVSLNALDYPDFSKTFDSKKITFPLEYKYVILDPKDNTILYWEEGENRRLPSVASISTDLIVVNDAAPRFALPQFKGAGTAVPVFSLRTKESFGCGEFLDLKKLANWASKTGQRMIQTLPINDTTTFGDWRDSYPYSAVSVYALHPMYLNVEKIGELKNPKEYKRRKKELEELEFVDYELVNRYKWEYFHELYKKEAKKTFTTEDFKIFFEANKEWLKPYAVFSFLRHQHKTADFTCWGDDARYDEKRVEEYCSSANRNYKDVAIHFFVQYHLHLQLKEAVEHAHSKGVALKGDIPIGVSRNSVDVWQHPELFDCGGSAGAPPDYFSKTGQVWGFPIYNWEEMAKDDYQWWKKRLSVMSEYYDAYRIDHILGFFRIFRTPVSSHYGLLGQFTPALPMSIPEIEEYGLKFDKEYYTRPIINDDILTQLFGEEKEEVASLYLEKTAENRYRLKEQYDTQEKIDRELGGDEEKEALKKKLYHLCCQVLFVEDYKEKGKYHPRIALPQSYLFPTLSRDMQERLRKIYEDFHYHRHNDFWKGVALRKLEPLIDSTNMMVCGEDLGMVPHCVASVMEELQILSLEIQRMPKEEYVEFGNLKKVPYLSVCTTSTHDMSTMRQWWETEREGVCRYFSNELHQYGDAPQYCEPWVAEQIVENHLKSPASWVILPLQDWMAVDGALRWSDTFKERINDPGDPNNYWRYRMHLRVEELISNDSFNDKIRHLIKTGVR